MTDKITNPNLLKIITAADFAKHEHSGVRANDADGDGKITEADRFQFNGRATSTDTKYLSLNNVCGEIAARDTYIGVSDKAQSILDRNGVKVSRDSRTTTGNRYDVLIIGTHHIRSYGGYDPDYGSCHYNRTGLQIDRGRNNSEISFAYEDATGKHLSYLNLKSGKSTKAK